MRFSISFFKRLVICACFFGHICALSIPVKQIIAGPQAGDKATNFSLKITFTNSQPTINDWQFGFYMPRSFRQTSRSNTKLALQICENNTKNCAPLVYQKAQFTEPDLSTVFTTIVAPQGKYPLKSGHEYTISLLHNSSRGPLNYSSLPQNLFINSDDGFISLSTNPKTYVITTKRDDKLPSPSQRIDNNWQNSSSIATPLNVIPAPLAVTLESDNSGFILGHDITIHDQSQTTIELTKLWVTALQTDRNVVASIDKTNDNRGIWLKLNTNDSQLDNPEAYRITTTTQQITVEASNPAGFFYALQTLRQLWFDRYHPIPAGVIYDAPRFKYRGIMVDVARHYLTIAQLKNFIDVMAAAKLNTLHLHLSDDEAFRLNLPDYPELAKISAQRGLGQTIGPLAMIQKNLSKSPNKLPTAIDNYQLSYSQEDISQLIKYANLRQITIIPEIDIPGHSRALMKALPASFYEQGDSSEYVGYGDDVIPVCLFNSNSQQGQEFTRDLITISYQISKLFDKQTTVYAVNHELSIGGDEVFPHTWEDSPSCQTAPWNKMSPRQKEHYFLDLFNSSAEVNHLKLSGWHEFILGRDNQTNTQHGILAGETGHVWVWSQGKTARKQAVELANNGYPVVIDFADTLYFDMTYTPAVNEPGFYWATKYGDTYAALTSASQITQAVAATTNPQNILGLEGALWADVIPDYSQLQYMALPKLAGLAEAAWSPASTTAQNLQPNWQSLATRLGCGDNGFLDYLNKTYSVTYRGYPNGIYREAPQVCQINNATKN